MRRLTTALALGAALCMTATAGATTDAPEMTDRAGDANFINNPAGDPNAGPETPAVSIAGADIRTISFDTTYTSSRLFNEDGTVARVFYTATGLNISVEMEGNILPTAGPSMGIRIPTQIGSCQTIFQTWWRGETAAADAGYQRTDIRKLGTCPGGANTVFNGLSQSISGKKVTMHLPFSAAVFSCTTATGCAPGLIADDVEIGPAPVFTDSQSNPYTTPQGVVGVQGVASAHAYPAPIDQAPRFDSYTIGSDVPADVDCALTPENPDCVTA